MAYYICRNCGNSFDAYPDEKGLILCACCGAEILEKTADKALEPGTMINGYEILRHLASGGEGDVYLAEQSAMERKVALKLLNTSRLDQKNIEHFFEEARNCAKFEDPHMVSVLDVGSSDGYCYIASRYLEGETLEALLGRGHSFSEEEALFIAMEVGSALSSVWDKNKMFHRDIKPGNIMLTHAGDVMILDMGIAQTYGESCLQDGVVEGSPYYMSPEHTRGENLSWSTDLYSLGATLYQMICGCYPYDADTVEEILEMHNNAPFPEISKRVPHIQVSPKVEALLRRMLGKTPAARFTSWKEFLTVAGQIRQELLARSESADSDLTGKVQSVSLSQPGRVKESADRSRNVFHRQVLFLCLFSFLLLCLLCTGFFLYLAGRTNSVYADKCLLEAREVVSEKNWRASDLEEVLNEFRHVIMRFGVKPSVRHRFMAYKKQAEERRILEEHEGKVLAELDLFAANVLQEIQKKLEIARHTPILEGKFGKNTAYRKTIGKLFAARSRVFKTKVFLPENVKRKKQIFHRLNVAIRTISREHVAVCSIRVVRHRRRHPLPKKNPAQIRKNVVKKAVPNGKKAVSRKKIAAAAGKRGVSARKPLSRQKQKILVLNAHQKRLLKELFMQEEEVRFSPKNLFLRKIRANNNWNNLVRSALTQGGAFFFEVYDSGKKFRDQEIRVHSLNKTLKIWYIRKNRIYFRNETKICVFSEIASGDWYDFLLRAAVLRKQEKQFEAYLLLTELYLILDEKKVKNPVVKRLLVPVRKLRGELLREKKK